MTTDDFIRQIGWEKWADPYGEDLDKNEWPGAFGTFETDKLIEKANQQEEEEAGYFDDEYEDEEWNEDHYNEMGQPKPSISNKQLRPVKILATPVGLVPMTEWTAPSRIFNFWTIHSNFRITPDIQGTLDTTDGVESLDIFTPYRWRIAIGKAFNENAVKERVMKNLQATPLKLPDTGE